MNRRVKIVKKNKKIINIESEYLTEGLFGVVLIWPLEILFLLKNYQIKPNFIIRSKNYGIEENDFNIVSKIIHLNYIPEKQLLPKELKKFLIREDEDNFFLSLEKIKKFNDENSEKLKDFDKANQIFFEYFNLKPILFDKINKNIDDYTLGIHIRGTDKKHDKFLNPEDKSLDEIFYKINLVLEKKKFKKIFLATDSKKIFDLFKERFSNYKIIFNDCVKFEEDESPFRTLDKTNIFEKRKFLDSSYNIQNGLNALADSISLSKCSLVLLNNSALSSWSKIFNPKIDIYRFNSLGIIDWFPNYYIPEFDISKI